MGGNFSLEFFFFWDALFQCLLRANFPTFGMSAVPCTAEVKVTNLVKYEVRIWALSVHSSLIMQWPQIKSLMTVTVKQPIQLLGKWSHPPKAIVLTKQTQRMTVYKANSLLAFFRIIFGRGDCLNGWENNVPEMLFALKLRSLIWPPSFVDTRPTSVSYICEQSPETSSRIWFHSFPFFKSIIFTLKIKSCVLLQPLTTAKECNCFFFSCDETFLGYSDTLMSLLWRDMEWL